MIRRQNIVRMGFTLVELILTVALLAILVSIAVPRAGWDAMGTVQSQTAAQQFSGYLKMARSMAITHAGTNGSGYKVVLPGSYASYSVINTGTAETVKGPVQIPEGITCSGSSEFCFTPLGQLQSGGALTLQFSKSNDTTVVRVTPVGRITVE